MKVGIYWRLATMFALGIIFGMFVTIRYLVPPSTQIKIGSVKVKGKGNSVRDMFDLTVDNSPEDTAGDPAAIYPQPLRKEVRKQRRNERKKRRQDPDDG